MFTDDSVPASNSHAQASTNISVTKRIHCTKRTSQVQTNNTRPVTRSSSAENSNSLVINSRGKNTTHNMGMGKSTSSSRRKHSKN